MGIEEADGSEGRSLESKRMFWAVLWAASECHTMSLKVVAPKFKEATIFRDENDEEGDSDDLLVVLSSTIFSTAKCWYHSENRVFEWAELVNQCLIYTFAKRWQWVLVWSGQRASDGLAKFNCGKKEKNIRSELSCIEVVSPCSGSSSSSRSNW